MDAISSINYLKQQDLYSMAESASQNLKKIFTQCLSVRDEKVLIIGDIGHQNKNIAAILSGAYYLCARQMNINAKLILQQPKLTHDNAEEHVVLSLSEINPKNIVIVNMSDKIGSIGKLGKSFRRFCKEKDHRFVSATGLGDLGNDKINDTMSAIDTNYKMMWTFHEKVKNAFDSSDEINIKTPAGTDLIYNVKGIKSISADGKYSFGGMGGNLPAGEVYIAPNGKRVEGKIVIDGSSKNMHGTMLIKEHITLDVKDGSIVEISGGKEAELLEKTINLAEQSAKNAGSVRRICEFGIGLNQNAKTIGATIVDDKSFGTAHIGVGSNFWFGGSIYATIHLDQIFKNPQIYLDGKRLEI